MSTMIETTSPQNIAELLASLGDIPPERIPLGQPFGSATEQDVLLFLEAPRKRICELVDGILVEKAMGYQESILAGILIQLLNAFIRPRKLGIVSGEQGTIRMWPGRVRIPDVAFTSWERIPGQKVPAEAIPTLAPDLVVEVLSRTNTQQEMLLKREDYFSVGVRLIWEIDPATRTVEIFTHAGSPDAKLTITDQLTGGDVLPGFSLSLVELFSVLDAKPEEK